MYFKTYLIDITKLAAKVDNESFECGYELPKLPYSFEALEPVIDALLGLSTTATPNLGSGSNNYANFTVPPTGSYLYLIWDFRTATPALLCKGTSVSDVCCQCPT